MNMTKNNGQQNIPPTRLVISQGDLAGLVAAVIASEETVRRESLGGGAPVVWTATQKTRDVIGRHARSLGLRVVKSSAGVGVDWGNGGGANRLLLDAATCALSLGCPVVVWPVICRGPSSDELALVETIAAAVNRATLVSRLVSLDASEAGLPEVRIETPFVDLTDQQLAELACDVGVRFEDCWWWMDDSPLANAERERWGPLLPLPA